MNIMLVSVTERTREIGLRLAVGALEGEVLLQFLIEAVVLSALGGVAGLVGGVGIMNIMLVSVTERTREIGIRLAIGALEREVLLQFLIEAVVLASLGGLAGIVLAAGASYALANMMSLPFVFDPGVNLLSFAFSAVIGVVFGYFPARRAARA